MSLYNMLFGVNKLAPVLLAVLNLKPSDIPRFRDAYLDDDFIVIHTRTGGGNREEYQAENDKLCAHPLYDRDADEEFDDTYANFYFKFPEEFAEDLKAVSRLTEGAKPSEKWKALLAALDEEAKKKAKEKDDAKTDPA